MEPHFSVPYLSLPVVNSNGRLGEELMLRDPINRVCPRRCAYDTHITQKSGNTFTILQLGLHGLECWSHSGSSHFARTAHCLCVRRGVCRFCVPVRRPPQGMEHRAGARRVVAIDPRTTSAVCIVADEGTNSTEGTRKESSRVSGWPSTVFRSAGSSPRRKLSPTREYEWQSWRQPWQRWASPTPLTRPFRRRRFRSMCVQCTSALHQRKLSWNMREEVVQAQEVLAQAQAKLPSE